MNEFELDGNLKALVERLRRIELANEECFLCAKSITDGHYTREHVIPGWVQRRYNLWGQQLELLNKTPILYRQLTVPCCDDCNNNWLCSLENLLSRATELGHRAVKSLPQDRLILWLSKIFFGILYKELYLLLDRSDPRGKKIITPDFLCRYDELRFFLQQVRKKVRLVDFNQGSVFVFEMQQLPKPEQQWDLRDNVDTQFIACRIGNTALLAVLNDSGIQQHLDQAFEVIRDMPLHPQQFLELCAIVSYESSLTTRLPNYFTLQGTPHQVYRGPMGFSMKPVAKEWNYEDYAKFLHFYTQMPIENIFEPPDRVATCLIKENSEPNFMDIKEYPEW